MTFSKSALTLTTLVFVGIFGGGIYLFSQAPQLLKNQIEAKASEALGVPVTIGALGLDYKAKTAVAGPIKIGNPAGFDKPNALEIARVEAALGEITSELVQIKSIDISGVDVFVEVKSQGSNLMALKDGMGKPAPAPVPDPEEGDEPEEAPIKSGPKVAVNQLTLSDINVRPTLTLVEASDLEPVAISDIVISGIGTQGNGVLARQAIEQVVAEIISQASSTAVNSGFYRGMEDDVLRSLGYDNLDLLKEDAREIGDKIKGLFE